MRLNRLSPILVKKLENWHDKEFIDKRFTIIKDIN